MKRMLASLAVAALFISTLATLGRAHTQTLLDPDDNDGPLDIVAARESHRVKGRAMTLKFKMVTYDEWENGRLSGTWNFVDVTFYSQERGVSACFRIRQSSDGSLEGQMYRKCYFNGVGEPAGEPQPVTRPDDHALVASFPRNLVAPRLRDYRWQIVSSFEDPAWTGCEPPETLPPEKPYGTCTDFTKQTRHTFD